MGVYSPELGAYRQRKKVKEGVPIFKRTRSSNHYYLGVSNGAATGIIFPG